MNLKIGLIARADNTGLGNQTWEFYRHLKPHKTLVVDMTHLKHNSHYPDTRYPGAMVVKALPDPPATLPPECLAPFLEDLDVVFTAEVPYSPLLYYRAARRGVATVCQPNFEFLDQSGPEPSLYVPPTSWHFDDIACPRKILLPVPIATDRWPDAERRTDRATVARNILHVVGRPAIFDRSGTPELLQALTRVTSEVKVTLCCQRTGYLNQLLNCYAFPKNVTVDTYAMDKKNYWELYPGHDLMVLPRRFGGLCLPMQEALGAGMPVIMPDISPNADILPREWLVPAREVKRLGIDQNIVAYRTDPLALAQLIDRFATEESFYTGSVSQSLQIAEQRSWSAMLPRYEEVFESMFEEAQ